MSDITANVVVSNPSQLFTLARSFKAISNGRIYIGQIDTDPVDPANQIQVYLENEDGSHVPVAQPIIINAAGYPVYNGEIAKFVTVQGHSMAIYDAYNVQQFYYPNVLKYDPDQLSQQLAAPGNIMVDDSRVGVKQPMVGAYLRSQHEKNTDYVTPEDFGAIGDGTAHPLSERFATLSTAQAVYPFVTSLAQTIDWAALQAALNTGKPLRIKSIYVVGSKLTSSNKNISVIGEGPKKSKIIFSTTDGGFDFTFTPQSTGVTPQQLSMSNFSIATGVNVTTPAIRANWGVRQPNAYGQAWLSDINIVSNDNTSGSFEAGIDLIYCFGGFVDRVKVLGDNSRTGNDGFRVQGCVEIHFTNCHANRYKCPARIKKYVPENDQTEGVFFNSCFLYDCNMGLVSPDQAIHINLIGTFINPNVTTGNIASIDLTNCSQYTIIGCLLYIGGLSTDGNNQDGIRISGGAGGIVDSNQIISVMKANTRYGILISGDAIYGKFTNNKISGFSNEGIRIISSTAKGNHVTDNFLYDCTFQIGDSGTGTYKANNVQCAALDTPKALNPLMVNTTGQAGVGRISGDSNWGTLIWPNSGSSADIGLAGVDGAVVAGVAVGRFGVKVFTKTALPGAALFGGMAGLIAVSDDAGGFTLAFSDGTNWRRVADRNIIS